MNTLSLDLRGRDLARILPADPPAAGAGVSLLLHTLGISILFLLPLLRSTSPPEVTNVLATSLVRPITVTLPPAPVRPGSAGPSRSRPAPALVRLVTPPQTPDSLNLPDRLDAQPAPLAGPETGGGGDVGAGDCPLGSLCGTALPAPDPPRPRTVRVGGLIREPRLVESRPPQYPPIAQAAGLAGKVLVEAHVGEDGRILDARILEGHTLFNAAALASVLSRRYEPLLLNGVPTDFVVSITVVFSVRR
jgi:protein TonB